MNQFKESKDFREYYDTTLKRHIWVLGYFGGGSINVEEAYEAAKQYAKEYKVSLKSVRIDEISRSRRFKRFKFITSDEIQTPSETSEKMENVSSWIWD